MIKQAFLPLSILFLVLAACGDNIHPDSDSVGDDNGACLEGDCPSDIDPPDAGTPAPDGGDTGGGSDGGTVGGSDGGTGGGSDGGGGGTDAGTCGTCPEGQVCVDGACVCDQGGNPSNGGCAPDEVQLCHVPDGNPGASHGICVGPSAVPAHEAHGDKPGACP